MLLLLFVMMAAGWFQDEWADRGEPVTVAGQQLTVADGDSFAVGTRRLRLDGIDAPEYRQTCNDAVGRSWECGKAARASLEQMLRKPGLACTTKAQDRYARSIATCSAAQIPDIAAAQVRDGMAVSDEFYGLRSYGDEEDTARAARRGIWLGQFVSPSEWRDRYPARSIGTPPNE